MASTFWHTGDISLHSGYMAFAKKSHFYAPGRTSGILAAASYRLCKRLNNQGLWIVHPALLDGIFQICSSLQSSTSTLKADLSGGSKQLHQQETALKNLDLPAMHGCIGRDATASVVSPKWHLLHPPPQPRNKISSSYSSRYVVEFLAPYFGEAFHFDLCILQMVLF